MRKHIFIYLLFFLSQSKLAFSQLPFIQWQKSFGGSNTEHPLNSQRTIQTTDGGYVIAGYSDSNDGDVAINYGRNDIWIVKLDALGNQQWKQSIGGSGGEEAYSIQQTLDGGYIVAGAQRNINNVPGNGNHGNADFFIVKLSSMGAIQHCQYQSPTGEKLGGTSAEIATSIQQTADSGYIVAGYSYSSDGDVSSNYGQSDYWIVKLNSCLGIQWQKSYGGSLEDEAYSIQQTTDGGYIVAGNSRSYDFDVTGNIGNHDYWILKLNNVGNLIWQHSYGGAALDYPKSIQQTNDGGYIIAGYSNSQVGATGNHQGSFDFYVVKISSTGAMQWQKSLGGRKDDGALAIQQTCDGGYIVAGYALSDDGDITNHHGSNTTQDSWIIKLSDAGSIEWQNSLGGTDNDAATSIQQTSDNGYIICGYSFSTDGDITANNGGEDFWIVKLQQPPISITANGPTTFCKGDTINLTINSGNSFLWNNGATTQNINVTSSGTYSAIVNGCYATESKIMKSNFCNFDISLRVLIEGYYQDSSTMYSVIDPINHPLVCDSVTLSLAQPVSPYSILYSKRVAIDIQGNCNANFITAPDYDKYYFILQHRNSLETWSKLPVTIGLYTNYDFTY